MFRSHSDHLQGANIFLIKATDFKISDFNEEYMSSLKMIWIRSKHVGSFLNVLIRTFYTNILLYRVIHKSLREFRPLRYSSRDGHVEGEHANRGRDTPSFCPTLQVLDMLTSEGSWQTFLAHARQQHTIKGQKTHQRLRWTATQLDEGKWKVEWKDKLLEWPDRSCLLLYVSARIH